MEEGPVEIEEGDAPAEGARWARDQTVVWCGRVAALQQAARDGHTELELGAVKLDAEGVQGVVSILDAVESLSLTNCGLTADLLAALGAKLGAVAQSPLRGLGVSANP